MRIWWRFGQLRMKTLLRQKSKSSMLESGEKKKKIVFSKTLTQVGWGCQLFKGDIAEGINEPRAQPGTDMIVGGANLAVTFMKLGLINEYRLYIFPIILVNGKPMFPLLQDKVDLRLVETRMFGSRVVMLRLENKPT